MSFSSNMWKTHVMRYFPSGHQNGIHDGLLLLPTVRLMTSYATENPLRFRHGHWIIITLYQSSVDNIRMFNEQFHTNQ